MFSSLFQVQAQCSLQCEHVNTSVDENCEAIVSIDDISPTRLNPNRCPGGDFLLILIQEDGDTVGVDPMEVMITRADLGTLTAIVWDLNTNNYCWSYVTVEDKLGPTIICDTVTVPCIDFDNYINEGPEVDDNCSPNHVTVEVINQVPTPLLCNDSLIRQVLITWQATDGSGAVATCNQIVNVGRIELDSILCPPSYTLFDGTALYCDEEHLYDLNGDGVLDWEILGTPTYQGLPLEPGQHVECNIGVTFEDIEFPVLNCVKKVMRTWTVREWWCNTELEWVCQQFIEIIDRTGPVVTCPPDMTLTTSPGECDAQVNLPPATVYDECSNIIQVDVTWPGGYLPTNGGVANLPVGHYAVTYRAYDECLNVDSCHMWVTIEDNTPPVAICDQHTVISLTNNGTGRIYWQTFDDGSYDECAIDSIRVRRMDTTCGDTYWREYVEFNCCDLDNNPVMVVFRVWDRSGNWNECMVEVEVQDKLPPVIICPPDITVSCLFPYDLSNLSIFGEVVYLEDFAHLGDPVLDPRSDIIIDDPENTNLPQPYNWGKDGYAYGSCDLTITEDATPYIDQCGRGFIIRTFTATTASGISRQCQQYVSFEDFTPFGDHFIVWPPDVETSGCGRDIDPSITGEPEILNDDCELIGISEPEDWVFHFTEESTAACFKVLRTWKVIDWCRYDPVSGDGLWKHVQIIKVINSEAPVITGCDDVSICSYDELCEDTHIDVSINASDDCSTFEDLRISYSIDFFDDFSFDVSNNSNPYADPNNPKNVASGTYPIGLHRIVWQVEDGCGNVTTCEAYIDVKNCKAPNPYCIAGLSTSLMGVDTDGDGTIDWGEIEIWASDFDAKSNHPCYPTVELSFSSDVNDKSITFDCDDLGRQYVELWVTAPNGEQAYCNTFIDIDDNADVCPPGSGGDSLGSITGLVSTGNGDDITEARIDLAGGDVYDMTNNNGQFGFMGMPFGGSYTVIPSREDHYLNGVTANDLSLIQRHISGIETFDNPYQFFAADANDDGYVDVIDVLELRKLLLGITTELDNHEPWMFLDAACQFTSHNPLAEPCAREYDIPLFSSDMIVDFVGVKIGDVDYDAEVNLDGGETRSSRRITLVTSDIDMKAGESYEVAIEVADRAALRALQLTYMMDPGSAIIESIRGSAMAEAAFNTTFSSRGMVSQVWSSTTEQTFGEQSIVVLEIRAKQDSRLSEVLQAGSDITELAGFDSHGKLDVELVFEQQGVAVEGGSFVLHQNQPNPFNDQTAIQFILDEDAHVMLTITDVAGRVLYSTTGDFAAGQNTINLMKSQFHASGVLYYRLETGKHSATKKMIVLD